MLYNGCRVHKANSAGKKQCPYCVRFMPVLCPFSVQITSLLNKNFSAIIGIVESSRNEMPLFAKGFPRHTHLKLSARYRRKVRVGLSRRAVGRILNGNKRQAGLATTTAETANYKQPNSEHKVKAQDKSKVRKLSVREPIPSCTRP